MAHFKQLLSQRSYNLHFPKKHVNDIQRFVAKHQIEANPEKAPFQLRIDFWAFSFAVALARGLTPLDGPVSKWGRKFVDTRNVDMSDRLCDMLAVAAFHYLGYEHEKVDDPRKIIEIANCLAGAGCPLVLEQLQSDDIRLTPLDKALNYAASTLQQIPTPRM